MITSVTVTKQSVSQSMIGQFSVVWELKGFDGATELFSQTFNEDYKTGDAPSRVMLGFKDKMQAYINKYKTEQVLLNHALMDTAVSTVRAALEV